jgi:glucokinase
LRGKSEWENVLFDKQPIQQTKATSLAIVGAVDIGGTKIAVGAISSDGRIISSREIPTLPEQGFTAAIERIQALLHELASSAHLAYEGIGVACPGPLDPLTGILDEVGTLPGWQGGNLMAAFGTEFNTSVAVENDADAAALAEAHWGAGKGSRHLIYITVSTGIGGGIVLGGELYRGTRGVHPELGHQIIDPAGPLCYCRAHGCWESLASGSAIASWVAEQSPLTAPRTAEQIAALAENGDALALKAMEREGYYLGVGLANIITLFVPDKIVLGGGVMKSKHLFLARALQVIQQVCTQVPLENTSIEAAALGATTGLMGAAQTWFARHGES